MATDITMPKLSDTMTEGRLISWKKSVGDKVERGDVIAEVETDKANMELEAFSPGYLLEQRAKPGDVVPVGTVIGTVGEAGEKVADVPGAVQKEEPRATEPAPGRPKDEAPAVKPEEPPKGKEEPEPLPPSKPAGAGEVPGPDIDLEQPGSQEVPPAAEPERASPLVRKLAREHGIDLKDIPGSGPEGRIIREDLDREIERRSGKEDAGRTAPPPPPGPVPGTVVPLSRMRHAIARTVVESWRAAPHFALTVSIDMGEAEAMYRGLKETGKTLSLNDLVVKASTLALLKFPLVNATFTEQEIVTHADVNIGVAVSLPEGLVVPVLRECQRRSLVEIGEMSRELVNRARSGKFNETDLTGGTFSISNLGMYGIEEFMAVIYPPQGAILAVGAISDRPGIIKGQVVPQRVMKATLSADHRLLDGAYAAQFLGEIKRILEHPVLMFV